MSDAHEDGALDAARLKTDQRKRLKEIQAIVNFRDDSEVDEMIEELHAHLGKQPRRKMKILNDRKERGGHDREG
jgi:hypothetical protein